jgi:hypothetical protein
LSSLQVCGLLDLLTGNKRLKGKMMDYHNNSEQFPPVEGNKTSISGDIFVIALILGTILYWVI